ncbi:DUF5704 domain-containing protein [Paenibacillus segetis]|uniref:DUF5704 domain-containing protein n=1 Tax=Paenibacillus segetis TaxID=1325360 RepID=A0ABQ1YGR4_9BACL|nr:DUF5704 domain-containing protein [Paenibacillus segetis]GGH25618.1 hypothetical protein GCM10008013_26020 [Paenibacillus segetis]
MIRKKQSLVSLVMICILFIMSFSEVQAAAGVKGPVTLQWTRSEQNNNVYYSVGMGYADVWTNSAGQYIADPYTGQRLAPGTTMAEAHYDWEYQFIYSGRKVKSITAESFNQNIVPGESSTWVDRMFATARYGATWDSLRQTFATVHSVDIKQKRGLGTDTATIRINESFTLDAPRPEVYDTTEFDPGVKSYRYYFPILFKAELEPNEGKAIIKHFTTEGVSINGVDGFRDTEKKLEINTLYTLLHTPGTQKYSYKGYRKSTSGDPSGSSMLIGDPMAFTYDGSFPVYYVNYYYEGDEPDPPDPGEGSAECTQPSPGQTMQGQDLSPNVSAVIKADSRGSERFNVLNGIPTTESLYGNVWSKTYLHNYVYQEMVGKCSFKINVTVLPPPPDPNAPAPEPTPPPAPGEEVEEPGTKVQVDVEKEYSFWTIQDVKIYRINESALWNYAFDGGGIRIQPSGYNEPYYNTESTNDYEPSDVPEDIKVNFDQDPQKAAESAVSVTVRNDTFTLYNQTLMSGSSSTNTGPTPLPIPTAPQIGDNVLYSPSNVIPMSKTNKASQPSTGTIYYNQVNGSETLNYPIYGINSVTVHTPVVIYPDVSDDKAHNQKTKAAAGRSAIILDRPFTVTMPNSGQHTNYLGYGNRNYLKYIGSKQVRFPFDVYDGSKTTFYPKNTWIEVEKSQETFPFFLPVWVDEGFYDVEFRTIAHNAPSGASHQTNANLDLTNHIAYDTVPVDAIGRVYDFRITDIADYNWETVFRTAQGAATPTGTSYWVGLNGIDGAARGITQRYTLPIRPGSHPLYKNAVIKTGYHFKFDLKTKGNMFGKLDQITIKPSFYFINAKDGSRTSVDLYYQTSSKSYVKIGSSRDQVERYVILNERLRSVPTEELTDTALYKYDHYYTFNQIAATGRSQFVQKYIEKTTKLKTPIGSLSLLRLTESIRTFIGPKTAIPVSVDPARVNASVQKWYGEYSLPADVYAVKTGVNVAEYGRTHGGLSDKSPIFLKNGYIVVNFNIETVRNGEVKAPYLQYIDAQLMNQWKQMEGFSSSVRDPYGVTLSLMDGDVVLYNTDKSSRDDFRSMVTH